MAKQPVTDKEVERARKEVEDLQAKVAAAKSGLVETEANRQNAVDLALFDSEKERLKAELEFLNDATKVSQGAAVEPQEPIEPPPVPSAAAESKEK